MYNVTIDKEFDFSRLEVPAGEYVMDAICLAQALTQHAVGTVEKVKWEYADHFLSGEPKEILIARPGSFGDLLLLTPLIERIRVEYPDSEVIVACHPRYSPILDGYVKYVEYPLTQEDFAKYDSVLWMEGALENPDDPLEKYVNNYGRRAGYTDKIESCVQYILTPDEEAWAEERYPKEEGKVRIGIQMKASSLNRTYGRLNVVKLMHHLLTKNVADELILIGAPGEVDFPDVDNIINLSAAGLSVRMSAAVLPSCDLIVVPDSLFLHLGAALGIPTIAICGSFDTAQSLCYNANHVHTIRGMGVCRNCRYHPTGGSHFPPERNCSITQNCTVIDGISPDYVCSSVKSVLAGRGVA